MTKREHEYIRALRWAFEQSEKHEGNDLFIFTGREIAEGAEISVGTLTALTRRYETDTPFRIRHDHADPLQGRYSLRYSAAMDYLDYTELQEAREASRDAQRAARKAYYLAVLAFVVSSILAVASVGFQLTGSFAPQDVRVVEWRTSETAPEASPGPTSRIEATAHVEAQDSAAEGNDEGNLVHPGPASDRPVAGEGR